ncbi:MAG: HAD family hydrolase [Candidatus Hodarchaeales archaeon]|jgi:HAD superfamily hydrolase (TIGR01549 family)
MTRLELLIFDFDDTVVHTGIDYTGLKKQIISRLNDNGYSALIDSVTPPSIAKYLEAIKEKEGVRSKLYRELMEEVEQFEIQGAENATMDPSYTDLFHELGKDFKLALLTNNSRKGVIKLMDRFGLSGYFHLIITRDDIPIMKPDPTGLQKILDHFNMNPQEAIFIGDSYIDMLASLAADIQFIGVGNLWDTRDKAYKKQISMIIQNLNEIKQIILDKYQHSEIS